MCGRLMRRTSMKKYIYALAVLLMICWQGYAQDGRSKSRTAGAGVTGHYSVRNPSMENSLDVLLLPGGKVKIYLYASWIGSVETGNVNVGEIKTVVPFRNGTAVYESGQCRIQIRFVRSRAIVTQTERGGDCGFGLNVSATGTYRKRNGRTPKFDF
jgi:hypothetical protein